MSGAVRRKRRRPAACYRNGLPSTPPGLTIELRRLNAEERWRFFLGYMAELVRHLEQRKG